jgi:hypothetical protein
LNHFELIEKTLNTRTFKHKFISIDKFLPRESTTTNAYGEVQIRNLIFQGGGIKGLAYLGCLKELEKEGEFDLNYYLLVNIFETTV